MQAQAREQQAGLAQRATALDLREEKVRVGEAQLVQKQQRVAEMEKDLRRMRQQLLEAQRRVEEEVRAQVRRANADIAHQSRILQERVLAAEAQTKKAEERQRQSHNEYLQLYESFNRFRTEQLTASAEGPAGRVLLDSQAQVQQLRTQHMEELRLAVERVEQRCGAQLAELSARCRELEDQNRRLTAALARRREQLEQYRHRDGDGKRARPAAATAAAPAPRQQLPLPITELSDELGRLRRERVLLVEGSAGALSAADDVVLRLDRRIKEMESQLGDYVNRALSGTAVML
ncbi:hypothetical protein STCU_08201 [Strigomonas culicis]|uniref:Uncharacterized protein n=1 Tax=Strigomonas culicis TaxID=28005 RepID=S9VHG9_9TRYP|nr:hypothetical protein STCU_08201 [Strigomonas culicis]|eukprot:EPY22625.1 hypothetical protein STCU_08201 [Strigomonas culicis]